MKYRADQNFKVVTGLTAMSMTGTHTGPAIDGRLFDEALVIWGIGEQDTDGDTTINIQESPSTTAGSFANITGACFGEKTGSTDLTTAQGRIDLRKRKRYIRVRAVASAGTAVVNSVSVVLCGAISLPVTQAATTSFAV